MNHRRLMIALLGTMSAFAWQTAAAAADLMLSEPIAMQDVSLLPAVSGVNGKFELYGGFLSPGGGAFRAAGSLSLPLGDRFGVQADVMATLSGNGLVYGGALHGFTRDPSSYLLGVTAGVVVAPDATLGALGVEGELYLDQISLEGWAGFAGINYVDPNVNDLQGLFAIGDIALYPLEDLRLAVGGSYLLGDLSVHAGAEYLFRDFGVPLSLTADTRLHANGNYAFMVGLKGYLGGNDDGKSLINRHREDDPPNRGVDLYGASGDLLFDEADAPDPEQACIIAHPFDWGAWWNGTDCVDPEIG